MPNTSESESENEKYWINWFLGLRGNEFFCEIDHEYITDRFNLTNLNGEVPYFTHALNVILDQPTDELDEGVRVEIEKAARTLYGLIHARYILTSRGLTKMLEKFKKEDFGKCPRVHCQGQAVLPVGLTDAPYLKAVKVYCPKCEDVYSPKSTKYQYVDGAFFGATFPHLFLLLNSDMVPQKTADRYLPRVFGFKVREITQIAAPPPAGLLQIAKQVQQSGEKNMMDIF